MWWPGPPVAGRRTAGIGIGGAGADGAPAESPGGGPEPVDVPAAVAASDLHRPVHGMDRAPGRSGLNGRALRGNTGAVERRGRLRERGPSRLGVPIGDPI